MLPVPEEPGQEAARCVSPGLGSMPPKLLHVSLGSRRPWLGRVDMGSCTRLLAGLWKGTAGPSLLAVEHRLEVSVGKIRHPSVRAGQT